MRIGLETSKGYARADLTDVWTRYVTSVTASQALANPDTTSQEGVTDDVTDRNSQSVTPSDQREQLFSDAVTAVTDDVREMDEPPYPDRYDRW